MNKQDWIINDCLEVMQEYPDNYFDLVVTDPPYGIDEANGKNHGRGGKTHFGGKMHAGRPVESKKYGFNDWDKERLGKKYFDEMMRVSKNQIIFGGNYYIDYLKPTSCMIVWDKDNSGDFADCELAWTSFDTAVRLFKYRWNGMLQGDMKNKEVRVHPTQKPVPLFEWILKNYVKPSDKILDPFCGSGTILEACMNLDLECLAIDRSSEWVPHYKKRLRLHDNKLGAYL
jgi:site-specific DNA-methyltransferase (adenine-specific)